MLGDMSGNAETTCSKPEPPLGEESTTKPAAKSVRHVQRSQVWEGSRGRALTFVHAHIGGIFTAVVGRRTTIERGESTSLCNRSPWYANDPAGDETRCPQCEQLAERYGIDWPVDAESGADVV